MIQFKAPNLPIPPVNYDQDHQQQLANALRLYFSRLDSNTPIQADYFLAESSSGETGYFKGYGYPLVMPHGAIQDSTDQYAAAANTATQVLFNTTDFVNQMTHVPNDGLTVEYAGIYNYQFSIQFANTDSQILEAAVWLKKKAAGAGASSNVAGTGSLFSIPNKHGSIDGYLCVAVNFYVQLGAGDTIELWWQANQTATSGGATGIYLHFDPAAGNVPIVPSAVATLSFVSAIP
jgi:hypothetical protein